MNEDDLCDLILDHAHVLTCFDCGETLGSQTSGTPNDTRVGILHIDPGERNYPREPDIPASAYFECVKCYDDGMDACEPAAEFRQKDRV